MMMGMGGGMDKVAGGESMLLAKTALLTPALQQDSSSLPKEPSIEEQIEQIKYFLDWLYEIKDEIDEAIWLNLTGSLEEMLEELEDSQ
jgi:hypothetical protein